MSREVTDWMNIAQCFYWSNERLLQFSQQFSAEIERVLAGQPSSLQAVKSYLALPTGREQGTYLALDFGGTNVRVSRIRLLGHHCFIVEKKIFPPLEEGRRIQLYDGADDGGRIVRFHCRSRRRSGRRQ